MTNQTPEQFPVGFDSTMAIFTAKASAAAYDSPPGSLKKFVDSLPAGSVFNSFQNPDTDAFYLTIEKDGNLYIIFRGTRSFKNLLEDVSVEMVPIGAPQIILPVNGIKVHRGFQGDLGSLWYDLEPIIKAYVYNAQIIPHRIFLGGHSLGAGMAAQCAAYIWNKFRIQSIGYTFGQPQVGNRAWREFFEYAFPNWYRMIHLNDVVCRIPRLLWFYVQTATDMFFDEDDKLHIAMPGWKKLPYDLRGLCRHRWLDAELLLGDHAIKTYVDLLERKWGSKSV